MTKKLQSRTGIVGDLVWLYVPRVKKVGLAKTLGKFWTGPYYIVTKEPNDNYRLRSLTNKKLPKPVHSNRLKEYRFDERKTIPPPLLPLDEDEEEVSTYILDYIPENQLQEELAQAEAQDINEASLHQVPQEVSVPAKQAANTPREYPGPIDEEEENILKQDDVYLVDKVLAKRKRRGKWEYLVKWRGYDESQNTWEPKANILNPKLIDEFEQKQLAAKSHQQSK